MKSGQLAMVPHTLTVYLEKNSKSKIIWVYDLKNFTNFEFPW